MSSKENMNKSSKQTYEETWEEFKTSMNSLLNHMDEGTRSLLMKLALENQQLKKENEELKKKKHG